MATDFQISLNIKALNLYRFLRKTVLNSKHCDKIDTNVEFELTSDEFQDIVGYFSVLRIQDRILILNLLKTKHFATKILEKYPDEVAYINKNFKDNKWDFTTKKLFKEDIKKVFKEEEEEVG